MTSTKLDLQKPPKFLEMLGSKGFEFDDELAPITVTVECEVTFDWSGYDEISSTDWYES